jgi:hypothetical protein
MLSLHKNQERPLIASRTLDGERGPEEVFYLLEITTGFARGMEGEEKKQHDEEVCKKR